MYTAPVPTGTSTCNSIGSLYSNHQLNQHLSKLTRNYDYEPHCL